MELTPEALRWHISLSSWLRDYLYIPLGGGRVSRVRKHINLLTTMLLGGLWHGAAWHYVVWGGIHGLGLVANHEYNDFAKKQGWLQGFHKSIAGKCVSGLCTFALVLLSWVFFRARDLDEAFLILSCMVIPHGSLESSTVLSTLASSAAFVLDDEGKLKLDYRIFDAWRLSPDGKRMKNTSWLRQHSHIWGVLGTIIGNLSSCQQDILTGKIWGSGIQTTQQPLISKRKSADAASAATTSKTAMIVAAQHLPQMQGAVSGETQKLWPVAQAVLREMKSACQENGAQLGIVRLAGRPEVGYTNPLETSLLKAEAHLDDTPCVDLSSAFDKAKNEGKTLFYIVHLAPDGHKVAANELSSFLKNLELLKSTGD